MNINNYTYILRCSDNTFYTGWTNNIERRLYIHNLGKGSRYTRARLPVKLVYLEIFDDKIAAMKREAEIKKMSREQKLKLIESYTCIKID